MYLVIHSFILSIYLFISLSQKAADCRPDPALFKAGVCACVCVRVCVRVCVCLCVCVCGCV